MKKFALAVALSALFTVPAAHADDLVFTIKNATRGTVMYFHASPANVDDWEEDILGSDILSPGESIRVTIADGRRQCRYDMRFEFHEDDNLEVLEDTQDLCKLGTYTLRQ